MNLLGFDPAQRYFHGSTHDITEFSKDMASPEGHFGAGFYFSSSPEDVAAYYATVPNPDLSAKVAKRAEELASERDVDYEDVLDEAYKEIAGESQGATYPIRLKTENTFDITKDGDTFLELRGPDLDPEDYRSEAMDGIFREDYDSVTEYNEALNERMQELADEDSYNFEFEGPLADFVESIERNQFLDANQDQVRELIEDIRMIGMDEGGISAKKLDELMRNTPLYAEDDMGRLVDNEVYRQAIEDAGFDSIVHDANIFKGMERTPEGAKHTIVFEPNQIRSEYAEYNPDNADSGNILASALGYGTTGLLGASAIMSPEAEAGAATQFIRLLEAGYPESTARKIMSGELPMDEASRMARAREQGFIKEAYHTGSPDIKEIDPTGSIGARSNSGMWFSEDPVVSASYTKPETAGYKVLLNDRGYGQYDAGGAAWNDFYSGSEYASVNDGFIGIDDLGISTTNQVARLAKELGDSGVEIPQVVDLGGNPRVMRQVAESMNPDIDFDRYLQDYQMDGATNYSAQDPSTVRSYYGAAFDPDNVGKPYIMGSPAAVGLLASEAATPEGQLNPLLAVPAEIGSALNEAVVGTLDFVGPDTVNAISELLGAEYRMPRLSDQELVRLYSQGGYMDEGYGRDFVRTATGLLQPF